MPSREIHKLISKLILGTSGEEIHKFMDAPVKKFGKNHRLNYTDPRGRHDLFTIAYLGLTKGTDAALHGLGHVAADKLFSDFENKLKRETNKIIKNAIKNFLG